MKKGGKIVRVKGLGRLPQNSICWTLQGCCTHGLSTVMVVYKKVCTRPSQNCSMDDGRAHKVLLLDVELLVVDSC